MNYFYYDKKASLLTKHGKEKIISKVLKDSVGLEVLHTDAYDTDLFGTFTGEIDRHGNQLEAAIAKARKGMEIGNTKIGIASEGLFTTDPYAGMFPWNNEIVILIDDERGIQIIGSASNTAQSYSACIQDIDNLDDLDEHLTKANFPSHGLVIRPDIQHHPEFLKGIDSYQALQQALIWAKNKSATGQVFIENDLRAFLNPTRMQTIRSASMNLVEKLNSCCPNCGIPGFWLTKVIFGLPCELCQNETKELKFEVWQCHQCLYQKNISNDKKYAEPCKCDFCNP
jgi:hypothetical protein